MDLAEIRRLIITAHLLLIDAAPFDILAGHWEAPVSDVDLGK
jgi:hypothetical protein